MSPHIISPGHALRLRATQVLQTSSGETRATGEEWLVRDVGAYLPGVFEEVVSMVKAVTLTPKLALHIRAIDSYTDQFGRKRHVGDEWLVTDEDTECYIPDVTEEVVKVVRLTVLKPRQYCVVVDAVGKDGRPQLGHRELRCGPLTFFLQPGERLESGIKNALLLQSDEAIVVTAQEELDDILPNGKKVHRSPGDRWMLNGPMDYIPPIEVGAFQTRKAIPLNENEGIYVRDVQTGQVRSVLGPQAYMLKANEELFEKTLVPLVEDILKKGGGIGDTNIRKMAYFESFVDDSYKKRDKTRVITYRCPNNCAVQVYNYAEKTARVVFGPDLVVLDPHETFNVLFLSAGKPKKPGALITICLMLGPDFISDELVVETSDHARLKVALAMNNYFTVKCGDAESEAKLFSVPDFIGFACREVGEESTHILHVYSSPFNLVSCSIASKIRGAVAGIPFEKFHKYSSEIIRAGVFGRDEHGKLRDQLVFPANNLVITNIDVQSIEPVDQQMRDSLSKSVQMAIEISTKSIERAAQHEAKRTEQKAKGELERQKLQNEKEAEEARCTLLELQAVAAAVESSGQSKAEAQARAERLLIEGQSAIELAELKAEAARIETNAELDCQTRAREAEIQFLKEQNELETSRARELGNIEVEKFSKTVDCIGQSTISTIAKAGPQAKMQLLQGLGIQNTLITDGKTPLNVYQASQGTLLSPPLAH
ncbi:Major vault protein [Geodia barretti]|uniref:Major vault protein n=1 Tax=Geodia barretti TaxID=519541 RepID=A0AA35XFT2_GEOBA|nr:Major vault protein [Geodia barretti]